MNLKEDTLDEKIVYKGDFLTVINQQVRLPDNKIAKRDIVRHPGAVAIIAIKDDKILLVEQFRKPFDTNFLEIPAGKIDFMENHKESALRELEEETGYTSDNLEFLGKIAPAPGFCDEYVYLYKATDLIERNSLACDDDEFLRLHEISLDKVKNMIINGLITDAKTISAVFFLGKKK